MAPRYLLLHPAEAATSDRLARDPAPVAEVLGLDVYTTRQTLIGTGIRRLGQGEDRADLESRRERLAALDLRALVIDEVETLPGRPLRVRGLAPDGRALALTGLESRQVGRLTPEDRLLIVPVCLRDPDEVLRGKPVPDCVSDETELHVLTDRGGWFALRPTGFNYNTLGPERRPALVANLKALCDRLAGAASSVTWHLGYPTNYDRPATDEPPDRYVRWAWALWRAGLLERPAAPGAADGAALDGLRRGIGSPREVLTAVPLRRRSLSWRSGARRLLTPLSLAILIYGTTFVLAFVGAQLRYEGGSAFTIWAMAGLLAIAGTLSIGFGVRHLQRWQRIADLPTARVRSVAMGPAELCGTARHDVNITTPYTRVPCTWYELRVERQRDWHPLDSPLARATRRGGWISLTGFRDRPQPWQIVVEGDSADLPFWLEDDTGRIQVDPRGAVWQLRGQEVFEVDADGVLFRVTERVLGDGVPLYVLGTVRRDEPDALDRRRQVIETLRELKQDPRAMARYDIDGDGRIDEEEWAQARRAVEATVAAEHATRTQEDTVCIGAGAPGDVFIISDRDEVELARRLRRLAYAGLVLGAASAASGVALIFGSAG